MEHVLRVTLDKSTQPWTVDIDQQGNANQIPRSPERQTIAWQLEGDAAQGELQPLIWVDAPPDGVFGPVKMIANGQRMELSDFNHDAATRGDWIYRLSVELDGQTYTTIDSTGTNTNPSIKNN